MTSTRPGLKSHGARILALVSDAHGGFGGISQYNRDALEAMCGWPTVARVDVVPRLCEGDPGALPPKLVYHLDGLGGKLSYVAAVTQCARRLSAIDLVFCGHINLLPIAAVAAALTRAPVVLSLHGVDAWTRHHPLRPALVRGCTSLILSVSELTRDRFLSWSRFPAERVAIVPNTVDLERFATADRTTDRTVAERFGLDGRTVLLTLGRMESQERAKGFDEVIHVVPRLAASIENLVYVAAGDGTDRARLMAKAKALGVGDRVVFTGRIDDATKRSLYRLAHAYVMPSRGEGFGIVVLEAMAAGLPVVVSACDGTREAVRGGELGIVVDPDDLDAIRRGILEALQRPRSVPAGLDYFTYERFSERLRSALSSVCAV